MHKGGQTTSETGLDFADCIRAKLMERTGTHSVQSDTTSAFSATDTPVVTPV